MKKLAMTLMLAPALLGAASAQTSQAEGAGRALNTDLRIYQNFAEVRQPVTAQGGSLTVVWPQSAWSGLIRDSLDLEGLPYSRAVHQTQASWLEGLEGREVVLHEPGRDPEAVTLVRARDLLIRDAQGMYRRVEATQLSFPEVPPESGYGVLPVSTFTLAPQVAGTGTLSYLTRSLSWTPRYTLRIDGGKPVLTALADISNSTDLSYEVGRTELLAGSVSLNERPMYARAAYTADMAAAPAPMVTETSISQEASLNGVYRYSLSGAFDLPARSTVTLPFMAATLSKFETYAALRRPFSEENDRGVLERGYRLTADQVLPGGGLTVREEGRLVGQTNIEETAAHKPVEFTLGRDPEVSYTRTVKTVSRSKTSEVYEVTYRLESSKKAPVQAEIAEYLYTNRIEVKGQGITKNGNQAQLTLTVPAGGTVSRSFTVTVPVNQ